MNLKEKQALEADGSTFLPKSRPNGSYDTAVEASVPEISPDAPEAPLINSAEIVDAISASTERIEASVKEAIEHNSKIEGKEQKRIIGMDINRKTWREAPGAMKIPLIDNIMFIFEE
jgi:hypothetical protein